MNCHLEFVALTDLLKLFPKHLQEDLTSRSGWNCSGAKELYCHQSILFASQELGVSAHASMEMPLWQHYKILPNILKRYFSKKGWNSFCPLLFLFGLQCPNYNRLAAFQCFIKTSLCISLKSVRHSLFLFLSSCLWRELCETWSVLFYFHRVHVVLFFLFLPTALYWVRERVSHRGLVGFHMEGEKLWGMWHMVFSMWYFVLQPQTSSQKTSAFFSKELKLPCNREGFVSTRQIHSGEILRSRSSRYSASHNLVLQQ